MLLVRCEALGDEDLVPARGTIIIYFIWADRSRLVFSHQPDTTLLHLEGRWKAGPEPISLQTSLRHRPVHEWRRLLEAVVESIGV